MMPPHIIIPDRIAEAASTRGAAENRSLQAQIEYWIRLGKTIEDNPELPIQFIRESLLALDKVEAGNKEEYKFG
ncbi:MAG: TA system antitoxin ParD family protein [Verrucomicrobiota bacterium]